MINKFLIGGYIESDFDNLLKLLKGVLNASKLRDRYASDVERTILYNSDVLDIYIYEAKEDYFIFDASYNGSLEEVSAFMNALGENLSNLKYEFDWRKVDEDDNEIGEEFEMKSTDG